ncbi:hypothetical protein ACU4GD_31405 [Cupriavidus basilensis]
MKRTASQVVLFERDQTCTYMARSGLIGGRSTIPLPARPCPQGPRDLAGSDKVAVTC